MIQKRVATAEDARTAARLDLQRAARILLGLTPADFAAIPVPQLRDRVVAHIEATGQGEPPLEQEIPQPTPQPIPQPQPQPQPAPSEPTQPATVEPETPGDDSLINLGKLAIILTGRVLASIEPRLQTLTETVRTVAAGGHAQPIKITLPNGTEYQGERPAHKLQGELLRLAVMSRTVNMGVWLSSGPGDGKTTAVLMLQEMLAKVFDQPDYRFGGIVAGRDSSIIDLIGFRDAHGRYERTPIVDAAINGGIIFCDEADRVEALMTSLNGIVSQRRIVTPEGAFPLHPNTVIVIATNSDGRGATRQINSVVAMDGSFRNRFYRLAWESDEALENTLIGPLTPQIAKWVAYCRAVRKHWQSLPEDLRPDIIISPRSLLAGSAMIRSDETVNLRKLADMLIWHGLVVPAEFVTFDRLLA